jgi:hypothetical protein
VLSYVFDHPNEVPDGSMAFILMALVDIKHPSRTHRIHPQLNQKINPSFIVDLANRLAIVYDSRN